jgi:hypothetical protein
MQKEIISNEDELDTPSTDAKGFVGMDLENTSPAGGRTTEQVRQAREANTHTAGGTHGGSKNPAAKEHQDRGGKEGNNGSHPF